MEAWTGKRGQSDSHFIAEVINDSTSVFEFSNLVYGEELTVNAVFESDELIGNGPITRLLFWMRDYALLLITAIGFVSVIIVNYYLWLKHGKDPKKGTIVPQYYPPENLGAAEISMLINNGKEDDNTFAAQLIELAVEGHLKINKKITKSGKDYFLITATEKKDHKSKATLIEDEFLNKLFGKHGYAIIREKFNPFVYKANEYLIETIKKKHEGMYYFKNSHLAVNQYLPVALVFIISLFVLNFYEGNVIFIPAFLLLSIITNILFLKLLYRPTKKGRKMLDDILGFEQFITYADELRINATNKPDMNFDYFEKNLPYAIALGKADEWGAKFKSEDFQAKYENSFYYISGYPFYRIGSLGALASAASFSSAPPSASGGASGGGFSGGGFSGGGAGGGGGGGW
jgi:uncharacterized membrane protein